MVPEDSQYLQHTDGLADTANAAWNGFKSGRDRLHQHLLAGRAHKLFMEVRESLRKSGVSVDEGMLTNFIAKLYAAADEYKKSRDFIVVGGHLFAEFGHFVSKFDTENPDVVKNVLSRFMQSVMLSAGVPENMYKLVLQQVEKLS